jgi:DNA-directed RNA polymerase specialized sigma24 family protein
MSVEPSLRSRVRASDPDAFAALFDEHARAVCRYAAGLTGNWSAAE